MENRPQWGTRAGFVLAAIGSAVGLGNIWRFPAVAYDNGGGAFFFPYLFALLTAGIPLLILEFTLGHKYKGSSPLTFARLNRKFEWLGWWQVAISFVISTYYPIIVAWALSYSWFSVNLSWGNDPGKFLMVDYLKRAPNPGEFIGLVPGVFIPLLIVWAVTLGVLFKGVKKGIEAANKFMLPTLIVLFLIIVLRAITLDGAAVGLDAFFKPDWKEIANPKVWVAAYGQIFFSLSVGFAIMLTYSSYLPKKTDLTNNAFITGFANSGFELLAGIGVFAVLGFMAQQQGVPVSEVVDSGIGLAFVVFPQIINEFPAFPEFFGFLFFFCLVLAGLTSLISIVETYVAGVQEKFNVSRTKAVAIGGGASFLVSVLYATNGGLYLLDSVDNFINHFGIVIAGLAEVVLVAWVAKELSTLQSHANAISDIRIGGWWKVALGVITPLVLGYMTVQNFITNLKDNYGDYPTSFLLFAGWGVAIAVVVVGFVFMSLKWGKNKLEVPDTREVS
ncbi:sodium-dependent transporter [Neobacillus notoginsengisoli]|uniref:Sodium-dependent transporter n=1 Tax=Neobacillus notoginsengisoli TaxID=1578198 RepID=A0A417YY40_9BACI|nr:sodium-dependent transporter [Neobacillus notoginsengisoli]RHW42656.1 sodium-dependent transporter [Neobacillus notoginsengisoli]